MKESLLLITLSLLTYVGINAQCPFSVSLSFQTEIDSFMINYPDCTSMPGGISISGGDITNLDGLSTLTYVGGELRISDNAVLANIDGLANIDSIGGNLRISDNAVLTNINGLINIDFVGGNLRISDNVVLANIDELSNLTSIGGYLRISDNAMLANVDGLANLNQIGVGEYLDISDNDVLSNIDGLTNLNSVGDRVSIKNNAVLTNIDGLASLTSIGGYLSIYDNTMLANIDGLANLTSIGEDLSIYNNAMLSNVDGLANLTSIGGYLYLSFNEVLTNIDGLASLASIGDYLEIYDNDMLALCCGVFPILNSGGVSGDIIIESNLPNCNSETEVLAACGEADDAFALSIQIYLQGAFDAEIGDMKTLANELLPLTQPYNSEPYNYTGTESVTTMPTNVVDWVLVEARVGVPSITEKVTTAIETKAGLLLNTGDIVGIDGTTALHFDNLVAGENYHFCIRHRNHMDVLSANPIMAEENMSYDFTTATNEAFGPFQQILLSNGKAALFVGDYNQDNVIQVSDADVWKTDPAQVNVYSPLDGTIDGIVQVTDFDAWQPNKAKIGTPEIGF